MYLWILLATIMVALSFFNLSPRVDKESAVNEVKAATLVNRFKIEHMAVYKTMKCEIALNKNTNEWMNGSSEGSVEIDADALNLGYIRYSENLPMGYKPQDNINVSHAVLCLNKQLEDTSAEVKECSAAGYRYLISFMKIPERWLSKVSGENGKPLPLLTGYMNSEGFSGIFYGWTECGESGSDGCILHGSATIKREFVKNNGNMEVAYKSVGENAVVWQDANFNSECKDGIPCLFAYTKFSNNDKGGYCKNIYDEWINEEG